MTIPSTFALCDAYTSGLSARVNILGTSYAVALRSTNYKVAFETSLKLVVVQYSWQSFVYRTRPISSLFQSSLLQLIAGTFLIINAIRCNRKCVRIPRDRLESASKIITTEWRVFSKCFHLAGTTMPTHIQVINNATIVLLQSTFLTRKDPQLKRLNTMQLYCCASKHWAIRYCSSQVLAFSCRLIMHTKL